MSAEVQGGGDGKAAASGSPAAGSSKVPSLSPLPFEALSKTVHVFRPSTAGKAAQPQAPGHPILQPLRTRSGAIPRVVLIMGWMNAPLRLVSKYATPYALLFPSATIIVKLSQGVSFMQSRQAQLGALDQVADLLCQANESSSARAALRQEVDRLQSNDAKQAGLTLDFDAQNSLSQRAEEKSDQTASQTTASNANGVQRQGGMLIHSFSDGGAFNVSMLLRLLKDRDALAPLAHVMDSSPGKASPYSGSTAMTLPLANRPWLRLIVRMSIYLYLYVIYAWKSLLQQKTWSRIMRERLNTPKLWSWPAAPAAADAKTSQSPRLPPRLYLYSKADALIDYRAVEEHAGLAAKAAGLAKPLQVDELRNHTDRDASKSVIALRQWQDVAHCDIGRADFEGYWTAVRTFLEACL